MNLYTKQKSGIYSLICYIEPCNLKVAYFVPLISGGPSIMQIKTAVFLLTYPQSTPLFIGSRLYRNSFATSFSARDTAGI